MCADVFLPHSDMLIINRRGGRGYKLVSAETVPASHHRTTPAGAYTYLVRNLNLLRDTRTVKDIEGRRFDQTFVLLSPF